MEHQCTVKDDNMMHEGLRQPRDEQRGRGQPRQEVLLDWAIRAPRRSHRIRRALNYAVFASHGSEIGAIASTSNQSLSRSKNLGKSKVQEKEVFKAVKHRKRVLEHHIAKGPSKRTKEPAENINAHVQGVNAESLHNQELQISARTAAEAKKKKKERKTELAVMKAEIKRLKEEQESINLKFSARREEELKEIAKRKEELHILKNNITSLRKEHNKLVLMTKAHIQGEGLTEELVCMSDDTELLEVSSVGQEAVTSGETHVQEVSSSKHPVLKEAIASGETHVPEVVSTSLRAALEEDRFVLPDLNDPLL